LSRRNRFQNPGIKGKSGERRKKPLTELKLESILGCSEEGEILGWMLERTKNMRIARGFGDKVVCAGAGSNGEGAEASF
jgi:hypothetical protein